ncbi:MAG: hypothetical protein LUE14_07755 [Clostridiales bacterium]|nr:hypothetical protein [Clostridiales bacterium]
MSSITNMVKELVNQPVTKDTESLFSERTKTLIHQIAEKCEKTNSPVDEYICRQRADDLLFYLVKECSGCKSEIYIEVLARILVPMIDNKLAWEEESEWLMARREARAAIFETDPEDVPVFPHGTVQGNAAQTAREFFRGLRTS